MTPVLLLGHAVLALGWLGLRALDETGRDRGAKALGAAGVVMGLAVVLMRGSLSAWRSVDIDPTAAAVAGVAVTCAWGLVLSLDLGLDRWWIGGLTGVASTGLLLVSGSTWTVPTLLFLGCCAAPAYIAAMRDSRSWLLALTVADAALVLALVSDATARDEWSLPGPAGPLLVVPLLIAVALRLGVVPRSGPPSRSASSALVPIVAGGGLIALIRWVERPDPWIAVGALVIAIGVVGWCVIRRSLDPRLVALWPALSAVGLCLASTKATTGAAVAGLLGITAMTLWPDALERGRVSRGFLLSGAVPNIAFAALATASVRSFARSGFGDTGQRVVAWNLVSALLPVLCASGVALGIFAARADRRGGYHPEAVFMTWMLLGGSVIGGAILGTGAVYGVLGGTPAAVLFAVALAMGGVAALRVATDDRDPGAYSATVGSSPPVELPAWTLGMAIAVHAATVGAIGWLTVRGLQVGFL
jgi:hypothetical protein